jgi:copper chaperone NosL
MAYQPPLIGNKQLLNFLAKSWPYIGGWFIGISFALAGFAIWLQRRGTLKTKTNRNIQLNLNIVTPTPQD